MWEANAETWTRQARAGYDVYRDALNTPAFLAMLPAISDLHGLDIGCGEGSNTRELARLGAQMHAIDIAPDLRSLRTVHGSKQSVRNPLSSRRCPFTTLRRQLIRFRDRLHVDDGYARPGACDARGAPGIASRRVFPMLNLAPMFLPRRIAGSCGMPMAPRGRLRSGATSTR
jgi:Methyltransferase domain